jgi:hypothetical protein
VELTHLVVGVVKPYELVERLLYLVLPTEIDDGTVLA